MWPVVKEKGKLYRKGLTFYFWFLVFVYVLVFSCCCLCGDGNWGYLYIHTSAYMCKVIEGEETQLLMLITSQNQDGKVGRADVITFLLKN